MNPNNLIIGLFAFWSDSIHKQQLASAIYYFDFVFTIFSYGIFSKSSGQKLIDALGSNRTIYWIAPFGHYLTWQESTIRILNELAEENKNLTILDWPKTASQHKDWFYDDGMHLILFVFEMIAACS